MRAGRENSERTEVAVATADSVDLDFGQLDDFFNFNFDHLFGHVPKPLTCPPDIGRPLGM